MHRRAFLARVGLAGATAVGGATTLAGCATLEGSDGGYDPPPVLDGRPAGVYVPTHTVGSRLVGARDAGDYRVALAYSYPLRFWTVAGTRVRRSAVADEDAVHLLAVVWEPSSGVVLPDAGVTVEVRRGDESVYEEVVYPMLGGRTGVHHGDNVPLPGEGEYAVRVTVGGPGARPRGDFAGRFSTVAGADFHFEFDPDERDALPIERLDDRAGERGAPAPDPPEGVPAGVAPPAADLPGRVVATVEDEDAVFPVVVLEGSGGDGRPYLAVSPRSAYNRFPLPAMGLTATLRRGGEAVFSGALRPAVDPAFGYHYGATVESVAAVESGDALSVAVPTRPQVARHEGYETAFGKLDGFEVRV